MADSSEALPPGQHNPGQSDPGQSDPGDLAPVLDAAQGWGVELDPEAIGRLSAYLNLMLEKNQHINLTAIRDRTRARFLHLLDSLAAGMLEAPDGPWMDLGTGNGYPGSVAGVLWPEQEGILVDRTRKKVVAVQELLESSGIAAASQVSTQWIDVSQAPSILPHWQDRFARVLARAVATPEKIAELADPLLFPGGELVLWLDADAKAPVRLPGPFLKEEDREYGLPGEDARVRRLATYRLA